MVSAKEEIFHNGLSLKAMQTQYYEVEQHPINFRCCKNTASLCITFLLFSVRRNIGKFET